MIFRVVKLATADTSRRLRKGRMGSGREEGRKGMIYEAGERREGRE
jgi:hypothetical protein